jgi:hypothetical protein
VGEQNGLNKTAAPNISENSQAFDFFLLYFQTIPAVTVQETSRYMQQNAQARNKPDIPDSQLLCMKDLYAFLAIIVQKMGHDHKPRMKLHWIKDEICHVPFYFSVMTRDRFLKILKYLQQKPPRQHGRSRLRQIMENETHTGRSKFKTFRTLSSNRTYRRGRSNGKIQRESHLLAVHKKEKRKRKEIWYKNL